MNKPLDFEELWDSFSVAERHAVISNIWHRHHFTSDMRVVEWKALPQLIRDELAQVDWEFTLGRRFHA